MSPKSENAGNVSISTIESWLSQRPKWLQTAARRALDTASRPNSAELCALVDLCKAEAEDKKAVKYETVTLGSLSASGAGSNLRLLGIKDVRGVNAIRTGAAIDFGTANITVIYGDNAAGKTGFARVIKQAAGSRAKEDLHTNVFDGKTEAPQATIDVSVGGTIHSYTWSANSGAIDALRDVHIFDSQSAAIYVAEPNEATYEPRSMRFLSVLIWICDEVTARLAAERAALVSHLPKIPTDLLETPTARWLAKLSATTSASDIDDKCSYSKDADAERLAGEAALAERDIPGRVTIPRQSRGLSKM